MDYLKNDLYARVASDPTIFDFLQESALDGIWYWDLQNPEGEWVNAKFWQVLGYDASTSIPSGTSVWRSHLVREDRLKLESMLSNKLQEKEFNEVFRFRHRLGRTKWLKCRGRVLRDENGNDIRVIAAFIDVSELKQREIFLDTCNEQAKIGYWEVDLVNESLYWSDITKEIHGESSSFEPRLEQAIFYYEEGEHRERIQFLLERAIATGEKFDGVFRIIQATGQPCWVKLIGIPEVVDGKTIRVYGTFQDIHTQQTQYEELQKTKNFFENAIVGTNLGTWEWNIKTGERHYSQQWAEMIGYTLEELGSTNVQTWEQLVHPEDLAKSNELIEKCFKKELEYYELELRIRHKNGQWVWVNDRGKVFSWDRQDRPLVMFGTHQDITARKNSMEQMSIFIGQSPAAIVMVDREMKYLAISERWISDYKLELQEVLGRSHYEIFPDIPAHWREIHNRCMQGTTEKCEEDLWIRESGEQVWIRWEIKPWYNGQGQVGGLFMSSEDITQKKNFEEQLRISEQMFRGTFENAGTGMALLDAEGKWIRMNRTLEHLFGYTPSEYETLSLPQLTHPDDLPHCLQIFDEFAAQQRDFFQGTKKYAHKNKFYLHVILALSAVRDQHGNLLFFIAQFVDISEWRKTQQQLADSLKRLQNVLDASVDVGIVETDLDGRILLFNRGAEKLLGYSGSEILHTHTPALFHAPEEIEDRAQDFFAKYGKWPTTFHEYMMDVVLGTPERSQRVFVRKDGSQFVAQLNISAIYEEGVCQGFLGIASDISHIKKAEKEINQLLKITQDQNARLRNFAHIVSHNLRSHASGITMLLDLLLHDFETIQDNETFDHLLKGSNNLMETISHLSEVVDAHFFDAQNLMSLALDDVVKRSIDTLIPLANQSQVELINQVADDLKVRAIPAYLDSIVFNFITNGIKYRSPDSTGFVRINAYEEDEFVVVAFEDNGLGIDLERFGNKLFGMYKTFHDHHDSKGVGLFITKNQVEALGGKIEVESQVGVGSIFKVYLPNGKN